jgi:hypothetical protein
MGSFTRRVPAAAIIAGAMLLVFALPAAAAPTTAGGRTTVHAQLATGVVCGAVTAYTAPALGADGSLTIAGLTDPVDAAASITAQATAALTASLPITTCLNLTVDGSGDITSIAIAAGGQLCGPVTATGTGAARVFSVGGALLPIATVDANLAALLNAAITANAQVCVDLTVDATTGAVTAVANLDATFTLCARVVASGTGAARTYTVGGLVIPATALSAAAAAALDLAITNDAVACVDVAIVNSVVTSATATVDVCVTVGTVSTTSVTLDGVAVPLAAGSNVTGDIRAGATLGLRISVNATTGAVTATTVTLAGCTASGTAGAGQTRLPDTSVTGSETAPVFVLIGMLGVAGAVALASRRRADLSA